MTVPDERLRALGWGQELLEVMRADQNLPKRLRQRASVLMESYPSFLELQDTIRNGEGGLPLNWADAIEAASRLFLEVQISRRGSDTMKFDLQSTRRHFPPVGDAASLAWSGSRAELIAWIDEDGSGSARPDSFTRTLASKSTS